MNIKQAISHFEWKLSNHWKPTAKDIEAYNKVVEFTEDKLKHQYNNNQLFGKLYITFYAELLKYYQTTVFDKTAQIELHKILSKPMDEVIKDFVNTATDVEQMIETKLKHPLQSKDFDIVEPVMTIEEAEQNLTSMINYALNEYSR